MELQMSGQVLRSNPEGLGLDRSSATTHNLLSGWKNGGGWVVPSGRSGGTQRYPALLCGSPYP
jgi:hypothetical protein